MISIETRGFQKALLTLQRMDVDKKAPEAVEYVASRLAQFAADNTPRVTGSMSDAWRSGVEGLSGRVFIDPAATNIRSGVPVTQYAGIVSERYGIMDAMVVEGGRLGTEALKEIRW